MSEHRDLIVLIKRTREQVREFHARRVKALGLDVAEDEDHADPLALEALLTMAQLRNFQGLLEADEQQRAEKERQCALERWPEGSDADQ